MNFKNSAIIAAGLGGWPIAAVAIETVVLRIPCAQNWTCMVHLEHNEDVLINVKFGHPQRGTRKGAYFTVPFSNTLAVKLWNAIESNIGHTEIVHECCRQWYPILYAKSFYDLLYLAAYYAWWPDEPIITRDKKGAWRVYGREKTVIVSPIQENIYVNNTTIGSYKTTQWLGTESQDILFFDLCKALKHERSVSPIDYSSQAP